MTAIKKYLFLPLFLVNLFALSACSDVRITEHTEWKTVFDKYGIKEAAFEYYDNNKEIANFYNAEMDSSRMSPASTFKIFNALVALETNAALDERMIIKFDGVKKFYRKGLLVKAGEDTTGAFNLPAWNQDLTMAEAFKVSSVPYFQELARRIGTKTMQHYLDTAHYGNMTIGTSADNFWLDGTLKISPDEQVGLMKRLYHDELPFSARSQRIVKGMMLQENEKDYKLYYKTGHGISEKTGEDILWVVGFAEVIHELNRPVKDNIDEKKMESIPHPYFFALCFKMPENTAGLNEMRINVLHDLLTMAGIYKYK